MGVPVGVAVGLAVGVPVGLAVGDVEGLATGAALPLEPVPSEPPQPETSVARARAANDREEIRMGDGYR